MMTMTAEQGAAARLDDVRARISAAAEAAGRDPSTVRLVAVSKTFAAAEIAPVLAAGQRLFGENRVQEAAGKWPALKERYPDVELHLIGALQTNKAREVVALFDAIHSLDRDKLAAEIAREIDKQARNPLLFVQVNTGEEPQKAGVLPSDTASFVRRCAEVHGLMISGLMCIPPIDQPPLPHFSMLKRLRDEIGLNLVSMGMSADFEEAVAEGATHVRVGSALFGSRG